MNKKRALLMNPPTGKFIREDRCQAPVQGLSSSLRMPLDLGYMAAILEQIGYECILKDYPAYDHTDWVAFLADFKQFKPHLLIISVTTPTILNDLKTFVEAKKIDPNVVTIAKGAHFITEDAEMMRRFKDLDIAIRGEPEDATREIGEGKPWESILGITYQREGKVHRNANRPFLTDMDALPLPARHLMDNSLYRRPDTDDPMTSIATNKGCPAKCIFCLVPAVSGYKIESRSPQSVADEMEQCYREYGIRDFYFRADTFTWFKEWTINVSKAIIEKNLPFRWVCNSRVDRIDEERLSWMKKAGCWMIGFGVETGDARLLKLMKKGATLENARRGISLTHQAGIKAYLFFTFGLPWEDEETVNKTIEFSRQLKGDFCEFQIMYPFPATELFDIASEHKLFEKEDIFKGHYRQGVIRSFTLSRDQLQHYRYLATRKYYLEPKRIFRILKGISSPKMFKNYFKKGLAVLKMSE